MADATYQPKVYREQGGDELVVTSSGVLTLEGTLTVASGGSVAVASGGSIAAASGASVTFAAGAYITEPVQTLTSTQTATNVTNYGLTLLTGTTTGPTYTLAAPSAAGMTKYLSLTHSSSGATHRCALNSNSTGVSFDTTGGNQITFATSALRGVTLKSASTTSWRIVGVYSGASLAAPKST